MKNANAFVHAFPSFVAEGEGEPSRDRQYQSLRGGQLHASIPARSEVDWGVVRRHHNLRARWLIAFRRKTRENHVECRDTWMCLATLRGTVLVECHEYSLRTMSLYSRSAMSPGFVPRVGDASASRGASLFAVDGLSCLPVAHHFISVTSMSALTLTRQ